MLQGVRCGYPLGEVSPHRKLPRASPDESVHYSSIPLWVRYTQPRAFQLRSPVTYSTHTSRSVLHFLLSFTFSTLVRLFFYYYYYYFLRMFDSGKLFLPPKSSGVELVGYTVPSLIPRAFPFALPHALPLNLYDEYVLQKETSYSPWKFILCYRHTTNLPYLKLGPCST